MSTAEAPVAPTITPTEPQPTTSVADALFKFSAWVHVGPQADVCEDVTEDTNTCSNPLHFHAWVHIPNQFEHEEARKKGQAARARRIRQLRDEQTDAFLVLDEEMESLAREGERARQPMIDELTKRDHWIENQEALRDVVTWEDPDLAEVDGDPEARRPFANLYDDRVRYAKLAEQSDEDRDADEFASLERHLTRALNMIDERFDERMKPLLDVYAEKDISTLVDELRELRIREAGTDAFLVAYNRHEWLLCTLRQPGGERVFGDDEALQRVAPEAYNALEAAFQEIERDAETISQGGS